jgi:transcriptional regulator with XRE-family HTH domain
MKKVRELGEFIRNQRQSAGVSVRKLAKLAGVSNPYLSQVERGLRRPSAEMLQAIAKGLRISAETLYVQAGILEERPPADVATAIMGDPAITERQKQALVQIYEAFREEAGRVTSPARMRANQRAPMSSRERKPASRKQPARSPTKRRREV